MCPPFNITQLSHIDLLIFSYSFIFLNPMSKDQNWQTFDPTVDNTDLRGIPYSLFRRSTLSYLREMLEASS